MTQLRTISATIKDGKARLSVNSKTIYEVPRGRLITDPAQMLADIAASIAKALDARTYKVRRPKPQDKVAVGETGVLRTRDGLDIAATYDFLKANANVMSGKRKEDGSIDVQYEGGTDVDWDSQKSVSACGAVLFVDENGRLHSSDDVVIEPR